MIENLNDVNKLIIEHLEAHQNIQIQKNTHCFNIFMDYDW